MSFMGRMIPGGVKPVFLVHRFQRCSLGRLLWRPERFRAVFVLSEQEIEGKDKGREQKMPGEVTWIDGHLAEEAWNWALMRRKQEVMPAAHV